MTRSDRASLPAAVSRSPRACILAAFALPPPEPRLSMNSSGLQAGSWTTPAWPCASIAARRICWRSTSLRNGCSVWADSRRGGGMWLFVLRLRCMPWLQPQEPVRVGCVGQLGRQRLRYRPRTLAAALGRPGPQVCRLRLEGFLLPGTCCSRDDVHPCYPCIDYRVVEHPRAPELVTADLNPVRQQGRMRTSLLHPLLVSSTWRMPPVRVSA